MKFVLLKLVFAGSVTLLLASCNVIDVDIDFSPDERLSSLVISQQEDRYAAIDPLLISDEIRAYVDRFVDTGAPRQSVVEQLQELLFGEENLNIQYDDKRTRTAIEVFEAREGNCISVMSLYIAIARYLDINADFQTVQVRPSWDRRGGLLVLNQHINATGKINQRNTYVVDFTPEIALQQLTSETIADESARALYFNNLAVEQMIAGEFRAAREYLQNALWIDPQLSVGWNNIGTVYSRLGQSELSEYSYQMAFYLDDTNATAINNLARFYTARGDSEKAATYRRASSRFNRMNPYYHYDQGNYAYQSGDYEAAIRHYTRAIRIKEVEPDFYLALAQVYALTGNARKQRQMISDANDMLAENLEIYQPSDQKIRFIDSQSILRNSSPGLSIIAN